MIHENEVPRLIGQLLPALSSRVNGIPRSVFRSVQVLADHTKRLIEDGNIHSVKLCFKVADLMLRQGDAVVKAAVQNVFIYSVCRAWEMNSPSAKTVRAALTDSLKREYYHQLYAKGS